MALQCGRDVVSHRFQLFRGEAAHTTVCGVAPWQAVGNPCHGVVRLCVEDPCTRMHAAERQAHNSHIPNISEAIRQIFFFPTLTMFTLDLGRFIIEIEDRPATWDVCCNDYSNKIS